MMKLYNTLFFLLLGMTLSCGGMIGDAKKGPTLDQKMPMITDISPASGLVGADIVINGSNFSSVAENNIVTFNGCGAIVTECASGYLKTSVPSGARTGIVTITIGNLTAASSASFIVVPAYVPAPAISSFSPSSGQPGSTVIISGSEFSTTPAENIVCFNNVPAYVSGATRNTLTVIVPASSSSGTITVTLWGKTATSLYNFTVLPVTIPVPAISGFTPESGPVDTVVTITGTDFDTVSANNTVMFGGTEAEVTESTTNSITAKVPTGAKTGAITVKVKGQTGVSSKYFLVPFPIIAGFTPAYGHAGTEVTITGSNFDPVPAHDTVMFNGSLATVKSATATSLIAVVPSGTTTGAICVTVGGQSGYSVKKFTIGIPSPTIGGFFPVSGSVGDGVIITGTGFDTDVANDIVKFNGVLAAVSSVSATYIAVTVPAGASTGVISVTVGDQTATSSASFTVIAPSPVITTIAPDSGYPGDTVTINGRNFDSVPANNIVKFNGALASVTQSSAIMIKAVVPNDAATGQISVTVAGLTALSPTIYTTPPAGTTSYSIKGTYFNKWDATRCTLNLSGTGVSLQTICAPDGVYSFRSLQPGNYTLTANVTSGEVSPDHRDIVITSNDSAGNDFNFVHDYWSVTGTTSGESIASVIEDSDGYCAVGFSPVSGKMKEICCVKYNRNGDVLWRKTSGGAEDDEGVKIRRASDGGYYLLCNSVSYTSSLAGMNGRLIKIDSDGNLSWDTMFGGFSYDAVSDFEIAGDGSLMVCGSSKSYSVNHDSDIWIVKVSPSGSLIWSKTLVGSSDEYAVGITRTSNGEYIIAGYTSSDSASVTGIIVTRIDDAGNVITSQSVASDVNEIPSGIISLGDRFAISASTCDSVTLRREAEIVILDASGSFISRTAYGSVGNSEFTSLCADGSGGLYAAGYLCKATGWKDKDFYLVKIASDGSAVWENLGEDKILTKGKVYGDGSEETARAVSVTTHGVILAGSSVSGSLSYLKVISCNANGIIP